MKWKSSRNIPQNAATLLPKVVEKYFKAGRKASEGNRTPSQLHKFRLKTKQFRYTLELFRPIYGKPLEQHLDTLHELQSVLGKLSDHETVRQTLDGDSTIEAKLEHATRRKLKEFHDRWAEFDKDGQLEEWKKFLSDVPANGAPKPRRKKQPNHSARKTSAGSMRAARKAG